MGCVPPCNQPLLLPWVLVSFKYRQLELVCNDDHQIEWKSQVSSTIFKMITLWHVTYRQWLQVDDPPFVTIPQDVSVETSDGTRSPCWDLYSSHIAHGVDPRQWSSLLLRRCLTPDACTQLQASCPSWKACWNILLTEMKYRNHSKVNRLVKDAHNPKCQHRQHGLTHF